MHLLMRETLPLKVRRGKKGHLLTHLSLIHFELKVRVTVSKVMEITPWLLKLRVCFYLPWNCCWFSSELFSHSFRVTCKMMLSKLSWWPAHLPFLSGHEAKCFNSRQWLVRQRQIASEFVSTMDMWHRREGKRGLNVYQLTHKYTKCFQVTWGIDFDFGCTFDTRTHMRVTAREGERKGFFLHP